MVDDKDADGLAIDILKAVAEREDWVLRFVPGSFPELLEKLEQDEIDILPTIAYSTARADVYDFTELSYLSNWGSVYARSDGSIQSILDLDGARIARLVGDTHGRELERLVDGFGLEVTWRDFPSYGAAIDAARFDRADAAIVSRLYQVDLSANGDLRETEIQINPVRLHFAAPKGRAGRHLAAIDGFLTEQKNDPASVYRMIVYQWLGGEKTSWRDDTHLMTFVAGGFAAAALFVIVSVVFRIQVRRKTVELREASESLESVLNGLADAVLIVAPDNTVRYANDTCKTLFGRDRAELIDKPFALPASVETTNDVQVLQPDGTIRDAELRGTALDYLGEPCVLVALRDISSRKAAERDVERNRKLLEAVLENIADGIVVCDADGELTLFNRATRELHGLPEEPLPPDQWARHYDLYMADGVTPMPMNRIPLFRALNGEQVRNAEMVVAAKGQMPRRLFASGTGIYDEDGNKIGAVVSMRDVTERVEAERALRESESLFRRAFESAGHGVALVGLDGSWLDVNAKVCEMFGYSREELLATDFQNITHPDDLDADLENVQQVLSGEIETYTMEKRYIRKDGSIMPAMLSVGLVRGDDEKPINFVSQISDLSEVKESEAKYLQAQKMEAVGNLTGGIAHDFNNILGVILGNLQLLQRRLKDEPKLLKFTATAVEATRRGADLTRQLLAFSRRQELEPTVLDPNEMVANMDKMLRRTLGDHIDIRTDLADNLGRVKADPAQLESAVLNLSINARDAMPDGGRLLIETSNEELDEAYLAQYEYAHPGPHVCISITDTGTGIPADMLQKIFQPFFTTKDVGKGTGLGLSMVYGFVRQSNGHINVYSEVGHGTRIRLYLPRTDAETTKYGTDAIDEDAVPTGTETVLVVEDEARVRETAALLLEDLGYSVIGAEDGPSALKSLDSIPNVDLVFTDMVMPGGMNGHQLADAVRERKPDIPILLTSGYPRDAFAEGRRFPLLQKPYTNGQLAHAIRAALDTSVETEPGGGNNIDDA